MSRLINLANLRSLQKNVPASGTPVRLDGYMIGTGVSFTAPSTIADTGSNFLNAGFVAGDKITLSGSTSNNATYTIDTVIAGTITVTSSDITTEAAGDTVTIENTADNKTYRVADGVKAVIKAKDDNTGDITVGGSSAEAINTGILYFTLVAGTAASFCVRHLRHIWIDATTSADGVEVIFEQ